MQTVIRLALLAILGVSLGSLVGYISAHEARIQEINELNKRLDISERPDKFLARGHRKVFKVVIYSPWGRGGGTASLVTTSKGNVVLTNKHICEGYSEDKFMFLEQEGARWYTKPVYASKRTDLCILEINKDLKDAEGYRISSTHLTKGDLVYVLGHPFLEPLTENHGRFVHEYKLPKIGGEAYDLSNLQVGRLSFFIRPGNSGSPVLNKDEQMVGVVFAVDELGGLFIPLSEVKRFLGEP